MRLVAVALLIGFSVSAHDIITTNLTFSRDISRIFSRRCAACHSTESTIPLMTYEQARPWAVSIKEQVLTRQMPPWGAVKGFGHLSNDAGLTQEEIFIISAWVLGGAPKGNPALLPASPNTGQALKPAAVKDALKVNTKATIAAALTVAAIRPLADTRIESARIVARFPDGRVEPLLWLYHYDPAWKQIFRFREPVTLPIGATVEAGAGLQFALETPR